MATHAAEPHASQSQHLQVHTSEISTPVPQQKPVSEGKVLLALMIPLFMALVAVSVVNVAMTPMARSLAASSSQIQWVVSGYALAFAVFLVSAGRLGDATGRRRVFVIGVTLFVLGSLGSGLAPNVELLIAARLIQGLGAGFFNPQTTGIIQELFTGQARAKAYAMFGTTVSIATMVGPLLGGILIRIFGESTGWRMMFLMNVPIGILGIIFALKWLPNDVTNAQAADKKRARLDLDPVGSTLMTLAILAFMWPFVQRGAGLITWAFLPLGLVLAWVFIRWENSYKAARKQPMLDTALFRQEAFRNGILTVGIYFLGGTSVWIIVAVYMQTHLEKSALYAALIGLPTSIISAIVAPLAGKYVLRAGRRMVIAGVLSMIAAMLASIATVWMIENGTLAAWSLAVPLILVGIGSGLVISPNQTLTMKSIPPRISGVAGGVMSLGQRLGTAVGTALIPGIMFSMTDAGYHWNLAFTASFAAIALLMLGGLYFAVKDRKREVREQATV